MIDACEVLHCLDMAEALRYLAIPFVERDIKAEALFTDRVVEEISCRNPVKLILSLFKEDASESLKEFLHTMRDTKTPGTPIRSYMVHTAEGQHIRDKELNIIESLYFVGRDKRMWNDFKRAVPTVAITLSDLEQKNTLLDSVRTQLPREFTLMNVLMHSCRYLNNTRQPEFDRVNNMLPLSSKERKSLQLGLVHTPSKEEEYQWHHLHPTALENPAVLSGYLRHHVYVGLRREGIVNSWYPINETEVRKAQVASNHMTSLLDQSGDRSILEVTRRYSMHRDTSGEYVIVLSEDDKLRETINARYRNNPHIMALNSMTVGILLEHLRDQYGVETVPAQVIQRACNPKDESHRSTDTSRSAVFEASSIEHFDTMLKLAGFKFCHRPRIERDEWQR